MLLCVPEGDPPTAESIRDTGFPVVSGEPVVLEDPAGSPFPNLARYFACPATGSVAAGDIRIIS